MDQPHPPTAPVVHRDELLAALEPITNDIRTLGEIIDGVLTTLEQKNSAPASKPTPARWQWRTLTGQARADLWAELNGWVTWFNARYGRAGEDVAIPPCWPQHPVAIEELTGLMVAWQAATATGEPSDAIVAWHDRWLWPCLQRLLGQGASAGGFRTCTFVVHDLKNEVDPPDVDPDLLAAVIEADLDAHPDPAPSPDPAEQTDQEDR